MKNKVSIVIPAYNAEKSIEKTLDSVLNQTYNNLEIIVVDDGSKDNTLEIIKKIQDDRLVIISKKNEGPSIARNIGIKRATGDYLLFVDADDLLEKHIIEKLINILNKKKYDVVLFKSVCINKERIFDISNLKSFNMDKNEINKLNISIYNKFEFYNQNLLGFDAPWGKIFNLMLIKEKNILFPEDTFRFEDAIFCKQVYDNVDESYYLSDVGYYYFANDNSICHKYNPKICDTIYNALTHLYEMTDDKQLFYIKCITSLSECEVLYFFNKQNNLSKRKIKSEYKNMLSKCLYKETLKKVNRKNIPLSYRIEVFLLKHKFISIYFGLKKIYFKQKGN